MARETINRCIWLVETIRRHGRITRTELARCWDRSPMSDGTPMSRKSFYNYRDMAQELFNLRIECDPSTYEYYVDEDSSQSDSVTNWLLNSMSLNRLLSDARDVASRISVENVPSAREHLGVIIDALKESSPVRFVYHAYTRVQGKEVTLRPYFVKLFKQRWYVVGYNTADERIKTYALDRIRDLVSLPDKFTPDPDIDPESYFADSYGIVVTQGDVRKVVLKADPRQAKYLAALPLHHSQIQIVGDRYSLFTLRLRITDDFVEELLSHGQGITVLEPPELRARIKAELSAALKNYTD